MCALILAGPAATPAILASTWRNCSRSRLMLNSGPGQLDRGAIARGDSGRAHCLRACPRSEDPLIISNARQIAGFALQNKLPLIGFKPHAEAGALMEYGADVRELFYRSAASADNIFRDPPADLPIERAANFELIVNLKTAKTLGVTVPLTLIASADEVIE